MCTFCKIVSGELPSMKVYEDLHSCVFMDIAGDVDGHMVAVPKMHVESLLDCDQATLHHLMDAVKRVSEHCVKHCGYEGVNLLNASGPCAGQSVPHFHIHIIPRKVGDGVDAWPNFRGSTQPIEAVYQALQVKDDGLCV